MRYQLVIWYFVLLASFKEIEQCFLTLLRRLQPERLDHLMVPVKLWIHNFFAKLIEVLFTLVNSVTFMSPGKITVVAYLKHVVRLGCKRFKGLNIGDKAILVEIDLLKL